MGFRPRAILVTWTQQDQAVPRESYINIGPICEAGQEDRYFLYSKLSIPASDWLRGDTFACVVGHEGLPMNFLHRSIDKASGWMFLVYELRDITEVEDDNPEKILWMTCFFADLFLLSLCYSTGVTFFKVGAGR
uniref:Immunoglobulin C1-set domain-containing protein n=1 Tax=Sphenodon punctatus TaxID=8508 RepID=A0A8D0G603_SPHPU